MTQAREVLPRLTAGIDWSAERVVIARRDKSAYLWWRRSGRYWSSILEPNKTAPAELVLAFCDEGKPFVYSSRCCQTVTLDEGGRLGVARIVKHRTAIDGVFGEGATDRIVAAWRQGETVVFGEGR